MDVGHTLKDQLRAKANLRKCIVCKQWDKKYLMRFVTHNGRPGYVHRRHDRAAGGGRETDASTRQ